MAKTRSQATTDTSSTNNTDNMNGSVQKPKPRKVRPGRRERQLLRGLKTAQQRASSVPEEAPVETDGKTLAPEHSTSSSPQPVQRQRTKAKKRRRSRGVRNRHYYTNTRPGSLDQRFGALSTRLSNVLKYSVVSSESSIKKYIDEKRDTFRDYLRAYIEHRRWDDVRRVTDVSLLKDFVEKETTAKEKRLREAYEKHDKDMQWLEDDLFDELRRRQDGHAESVQEALDAQREEFEQEMKAMKDGMRAMEETMGAVLRVSGEQQRWGIRAPALLAEDFD